MFLVAKIKVTFTFDLLTSKLKLPLNDFNTPPFMQLCLEVFNDEYMRTSLYASNVKM
jgi:hypothetical protein